MGEEGRRLQAVFAGHAGNSRRGESMSIIQPSIPNFSAAADVCTALRARLCAACLCARAAAFAGLCAYASAFEAVFI